MTSRHFHPTIFLANAGHKATLKAGLKATLMAGLMAVLGSSACTILYATGSDEANLPCGPVGGPRCLEGFACVADAAGTELCVPAGFKDVGDECTDSAECQSGAVCADAYASLCGDDDTDINCQDTSQSDTGLRCRALCDDVGGCGNGTRCFFFDGVDPFCQAGTCSTDTDCTFNAVPGLCVAETSGRDGLCAVQCDPIGCHDGSDCSCSLQEACATPVDEALSARAVCGAIGVINPGEVCDVVNPCVDGATCAPTTAGFSQCLQWCRVGGGAPACSGTICQGVDGIDPDLGICQ